MDIPSDFGSKWIVSDVILITENAEGRELHACKAVLAIYSHFFERMFFSDFKEVNEAVVNVSCDYDCLLEILRIVHYHKQDVYKEIRRYETPMLQELYIAADYLDVPAVIKMVKRQLLDKPSVETATAALILGLHETVMTILEKMDSESVKNFLAIDHSDVFFSKGDIYAIYKKITGNDVPSCKNLPSATFLTRESLSSDFGAAGNSLIDFSQKGMLNNVEIRTKNSDGKPLYSNIGTLATISPHLYNMFFGENSNKKSDENAENIILDLDVDYTVMKYILLYAHHCIQHSSFYKLSAKTVKILYFMYLTASEDKLNIPTIRTLCEDYLQQHKGVSTADIACKLGLHKLKSSILDQLSLDELHDWVYLGDEDLTYYTYYNGYVSFELLKEIHFLMTPGRKEHVLSLNDVRLVIEKFLAEFNKES